MQSQVAKQNTSFFIFRDSLAKGVYLMIGLIGFALYQICWVERYMTRSQHPYVVLVMMNALALCCYWIYYKACTVSPGKVTKQNVDDYLKKYEKHFDGQRFQRGNKCKTCLLDKPARSKHCSTCGICVARCDHHCSWIGQCIGQKNYKYFIAYLFSHAIWAILFFVFGAWTLIFHFSVPFSPMADPFSTIKYFFSKDALFSFLVLVSANTAIGLVILLLDHLRLIAKGETINERAKKQKEINYLDGELRAANKLVRQFHSQIKEINFRGEKLRKEELLDYKQECKRKKTDLQKCEDSRSFQEKIVQIFKM